MMTPFQDKSPRRVSGFQTSVPNRMADSPSYPPDPTSSYYVTPDPPAEMSVVPTLVPAHVPPSFAISMVPHRTSAKSASRQGGRTPAVGGVLKHHVAAESRVAHLRTTHGVPSPLG
jgi:hypothetical protein